VEPVSWLFTLPERRHVGRTAYRPEIDGLRALAILSVVLFHAFPSLLRGGFVGVDIFFVISGFLMCRTSISRQNHVCHRVRLQSRRGFQGETV